jgi:hypothetical protein
MKSKHFILLFLIPLSEAKALFFKSDLKVSWYLFSDNKRYLCNVVEDYSNIIILCTVFYYLCFVKIDLKLKKIGLFLFIINIFDLIHLGLLDLTYFIPVKLLLAYTTYTLCNKYGSF